MGTTLNRDSGLVPVAVGDDGRGGVTIASRFVESGPEPEQSDIFLEKLSYSLSKPQRKVIHDPSRLILVAGGERAGKSFVSGLFGATRTIYGDTFWIVGPDYALARPEFNYWVEMLMRLGAIRSDRDISAPKVGPAQAKTKTGQTILTKTADDTRKLAAVAPSGIIMAEAAQQDYDSYLRCVGRVAEKRGWLLMSGTFEGSMGWYADKYNDWLDPMNPEGGSLYSMPSWTNEVIYPGGRTDPEIQRLEALYSRVPGLFEERIGAVPVPPHSLIFREFRHTIHISEDAEFDPTLPTYLAVDPSDGTAPYAVLFCQFHKHFYEDEHPDPIDYCYVFDEIYLPGVIAEEVIEMAQKKRYWTTVRGGAIDVEAPDERRRWLKYANLNLHSESIHRLIGIRRLHSFLYYKQDSATGQITDPPHLLINPRVRSIPHEITKFKKRLPKDDDHELSNLPEPNLPDHSLTALWYLLISRYGEVKSGRIAKPAYNWKRRA